MSATNEDLQTVKNFIHFSKTFQEYFRKLAFYYVVIDPSKDNDYRDFCDKTTAITETEKWSVGVSSDKKSWAIQFGVKITKLLQDPNT
jgi:hypothetical protein